MFRILCLVFCIVIIGLQSNAQTVVVRDRQNSQPLDMVTVFTADEQQATHTNAGGKANINDFQYKDSIYFRLIGYEMMLTSYDALKRSKFEVYLTPSDMSLDEIVVSANKWRQGKRETPSKVAVIQPKDIQFNNPQTAADLIEASGEVYVQKSQMGGGSPMIRGFATNRVLIAIDGVRMNNAIFRSGNIQNIISLDPFATARSEIMFGPGSIIYGSDAIGGVMSFYTHEATLSHTNQGLNKLSATSRVASANNEKTGHAHFNLGFKNLASLTSISYSSFGDLTMGSNGPDDYLRPEYVIRENNEDKIVPNNDPKIQKPTGYNQLNLMQKFKFETANNWQFNYGFHYSGSSNVDRYDRLVMYRNDQLRYGDWYYGPQVWMMNHLNIANNKANKFYNHLNITIAHQLFKESRHNRNIYSSSISRRYEKVDALSINIDAEKHINAKNKLFYGFETVNNNISSKGKEENIADGSSVAGPSRYPDGSDWFSLATYANLLHKITPKLSLQGGLRYNYIYVHADFDDTFYQFPYDQTTITHGGLTGSAGLIFNPQQHVQLSATMSTGFRAPNIDDVGKVFDSEPGAVVVPNPDLTPEYAINGEVGIAVIMAELVKLDASAYYTHLTDALVRRDYTINGQDSVIYDGELSRVQAIQNAAHAYVYGVQCGVELKLPSGFSIESRFNYQKGMEELDDHSYSPLRHAAPWFGVSHLRYENKKLTTSLSCRYNGEVAYNDMPLSEIEKPYLYALDDNGLPYSPGWTIFDLRAQYRITDIIMATAAVENLTDVRYRTYSSGVSAPGRNYVLSLSIAL